MMATMTREESKTALRRRLRAMRVAITADARAAAHRAMARYLEQLLLASPVAAAEKEHVLGLYAAMPGEADPRGVCERLPAGWVAAWPRVAGDALELVSCREDELVTGYRGIREPPGDRAARRLEEVGVLIVPALAVDPHGHRLGQGGGHYDRLLARLREVAPGAIVVGLAYAAQILARIPVEAHDQRVDVVLSEHGLTGGA
jgi:5-formyltetrahydrofolate cyclo-ligase